MEEDYPIKTGEVYYNDENDNLWKATSYIINKEGDVVTENEPCDTSSPVT